MGGHAILIVGPSWVGDMVMAQSLFRLLKERRADTDIDVLAPAWSLPVLARMPEIRRGLALPVHHGELAFGKRRELGRSLRAAAYEQAIVLPRSMKAALVPWFAGIPRRTGYRGEMRYRIINDMRRLDDSVLDQTVKRFVALGLDQDEPLPRFPLPRLTLSTANQRQVMERLKLHPRRPVVALMPGAEYGPAKRWPLEYFTALAAMLDSAGRDVWVLGSDKDREAGAAIAAVPAARNLCGETELVDVIDLLGACSHAVSNDSGLMHVAAAAGTRVVALYGSSTPAYTPPLTEKRSIHYLALSCSPCFARVCPLGHLRCLRDIRPEQVAASLEA